MKVLLHFGILMLFALENVTCYEESDFEKLMNLLHKPVLPERVSPQYMGQASKQVLGFSWSNCGSSNDLAIIEQLTLSPDPLKVPGNVTVAASGSLSTAIGSPIKVELDIQKKIVFWITVPCLDNVGSCTYDDICSMLSHFSCPPEFKAHGIPCSCPVKAGPYNLPATPIHVDPVGIPSWAKSGDYKVNVKASYKQQQIFCLNMELSLA